MRIRLSDAFSASQRDALDRHSERLKYLELPIDCHEPQNDSIGSYSSRVMKCRQAAMDASDREKAAEFRLDLPYAEFPDAGAPQGWHAGFRRAPASCAICAAAKAMPQRRLAWDCVLD
ncbi:hypothetical protein QPR87_16800 [Paracoccus sp. SSJ]|nr:hypothetical protein [Paracoccus sp. SSJ]